MSSSALAIEPLFVNGNQVMVGGEYGSEAGNSSFWSDNDWGRESSTVSGLKSDWMTYRINVPLGV
ncbi:hypothetical protein [Microbulbifer agarilyticus]